MYKNCTVKTTEIAERYYRKPQSMEMMEHDHRLKGQYY